MRASSGLASSRAAAEEQVATTLMANLSPYDRLAVTGDGRAWVRLTVGGDEEPEKHRWAVVEGPDEPVRIAELPADFVPMDARDGIVYGRWTDPYGVHHVRAYHLSEAAEGGSAP